MMTNDNTRLQAYVDGELDLAGQLEIEQRLADDPGLRAQAQALRELRRVLREGADCHAVPVALRQRVARLLAPPSRGAGWWRRPGWAAATTALAAAGVLALAVNLAVQAPSNEARLVEYVVASHVRSTLGGHLVDVVSSDRHTVKPWLASKLDFSPPVTTQPLAGAVLLGARVDYLDGRPVAALVYRHGAHVVNTFVWPGAPPDRGPNFTAQRGFQLAHWSQGGMTHWVVSDLNRAEFSAFAQALMQAQGPP